MNKNIKTPLIIIIHFFFIAISYGQEDYTKEYPKFMGGMVAGINVSSFSDRIGEFGDGQSDIYQDYARISPLLGVHFRYQLSNLLYMRSGLYYNSRGDSYRYENTSIHTMGGGNEKKYYFKTYRLNYLEIPLMLDIGLLSNPDKDKLQVHFAGGISYGILLSSTLRQNGFRDGDQISGALVSVDETYDVDDFDYAKNTLINYLFELSFEFQNRKETPMFIRARYTSSFDTIYKQNEIDDFNLKTKMDTWSICFGLYLISNK